MNDKTVRELNSGGRKDRVAKKPRKVKSYDIKHPLYLQFRIPCSHPDRKTTAFKCKSIPLALVVRNRKVLYMRKKKIEQDIFLSRLISPFESQRKGTKVSKPNVKKRNRNLSCVYYILNKKKRMIRVCKTFFIAVFDITKRRLETLCKTLYNGNKVKENRGGNTCGNRYQSRKQSVRNFLNALPAQESHYGRDKSKRIYLACDYNVKKLWQLHNESVSDDLKVKKTMFNNIFRCEFNIGFSSPATDACNVCILWLNKIKQEQDSTKKQWLMTEYRVHKLRANAFYDYLRKKEPNSVSICFDLQQVQSLPRTPIQDAFYARQLSLYNFCIVPLNSKNPVFYSWDETQSARGSTEVGSAVYDYLKTNTFDNDVHHLRLFCDGCGGQNKNSHIIHMLLFFLLNDSPSHLKDITLFFPVRGHSFLPADRVFGRLEKEIRKKPVITSKDEYFVIFKRHGNLRVLGKDWVIKDMNRLEEYYKKLDHIQSLKRIYFYKKNLRCSNSVEIKVYENYKFESGSEKPISLLKKGKRHPSSLHDIDLAHRPLKESKKKDITNLLKKQFGDEWFNLDELQWYKMIINNSNCAPEEDHTAEIENNNMCDCLTEDIGEVRV